MDFVGGEERLKAACIAARAACKGTQSP